MPEEARHRSGRHAASASTGSESKEVGSGGWSGRFVRSLSGWWIPGFLLVGMSLVILSVLSPHLIFSATTPTGGDMGAHVLVPAYLRDVLLPQGRVLGWSQSWFGGFPVFYYYFPLPSLVIVALDVFLPYGVAFKVATVLGLVGTPPAAFFLARCLNLGRMVSVVAATSGVVFGFLESYTI